MDELIEKMERATGADRELDVLIGAAVDVDCGLGLGLTFAVAVERFGVAWATESAEAHNSILWNALPRYTSSLDAALTLVPEGDYDQTWTKSTRGKGSWEHWTLHQVRICLETVADDPDETSPEAIGCHNVQAIALCIAALKARKSMESNHE